MVPLLRSSIIFTCGGYQYAAPTELAMGTATFIARLPVSPSPRLPFLNFDWCKLRIHLTL